MGGLAQERSEIRRTFTKKMKFISRHANLRVILRPTTKQVVNSQSGSEEVVKYPPIVVEFRGGLFDSASWKQFVNPEVPDKFNIIKSEDDLIDHLKRNPFFNADFSELKVESASDKRARLLHELSKLDAEEGITPSETAEIGSGDDLDEEVEELPKTKPKGRPGRKKAEKPNKDSVIDL